MLYLLRMLLLAIHFLSVGLIGLIIGVLRPFDINNTRLFANLYGLAAESILGMRIEAQIETLFAQPPGFVIIANHQSNFDLFVMGRFLAPRTVSVGKKSLKWLPLFGQLFWLGGNVLIDRGNPYQARRSLEATSRALRDEQTSIWVFPEGTRNPQPTLRPFKKGAFQMAVDAGVPIVPVCISRYAGRLRLGQWRSARIVIRALPAIGTHGLTRKDIGDLALECQALMQGCLDQIAIEGGDDDAPVNHRNNKQQTATKLK
ncbi:1-acylglycerol-3-phosphate O-acyltransferase [Pseudomonas baltica]|jgi:1-acyl-sn-glycerol-3-phosphate acyltransferase|uniref:lysophospholipid acyltransferase family protein n=1 Tax=Pseudomonas baltica TaxID=2762576 RepID=UPI0028A136E6|nr:1-acylglycerol-3-phosphate O-acyltransferase [Pseudomonas baltica]